MLFRGGVILECGERAWCSCSTLSRETNGGGGTGGMNKDPSSDPQCSGEEAKKLILRISCTSLHRFHCGGFLMDVSSAGIGVAPSREVTLTKRYRTHIVEVDNGDVRGQ